MDSFTLSIFEDTKIGQKSLYDTFDTIRPSDLLAIKIKVEPMAILRSRGSTGRRKDNPLGWEHYDSVKKANIMVGRVCILFMLAAAKSIFWIYWSSRSTH